MPPSEMKFKSLGNKVTEFAGFETFPAPKNVNEVTMMSDEVTAICPVTSQPDQYLVSVTYVPGKLCVESKTLKLYFQSFRNKGLFCEAFANQIAQDIMKALTPEMVAVTVTQKPRGGVSIKGMATIIGGR